MPEGYTYTWFHENILISGATGSVITTQEYGSYEVEVVDINGCVAKSAATIIHEYCDGPVGVCNNLGLPASCDQGTSVQFTFSSTGSCDMFNFTNTSPDFQAGTISWDFDDPNSGSNNSSTLENPSHEYTDAGYFIVTLTALNNAGVLCWDSKEVIVPIIANFNFGNSCVGSPTVFEDLSGVLPDESITSWSWDFGDPVSGANNTSLDQHPIHVYSIPGLSLIHI